jgi:signal peptidase I
MSESDINKNSEAEAEAFSVSEASGDKEEELKAAEAKAEETLTGFEAFKQKRKLRKEEKARKEAEKSTLQNIIETVIFAVVVFAIALFIKNFIGQPIIVDGSSMTDTLTDRDWVWANKINYTPERYDVVIVQPYLTDDKTTSENETKTLFIKRILALPGETIYFDENDLIHIKSADSDEFETISDPYGYFAGALYSKLIAPDTDKMSTDYTPGTYTLVYNTADVLGDDGVYSAGDNSDYTYSFDIYAYTLTDDEYFCVGDNRYNSHDSRSEDLGAFSSKQIKGHAVFRIWPFTRFGDFDKSNES